MPTPTTYTYSLSQDFPQGKINPDKLTTEIKNSSIVTALDHIDVNVDVVDLLFKDVLSAADKTTLDADAAGHPKGGLIQAHDNTPNPAVIQEVVFPTPQYTIRKPVPLGTIRNYSFCPNFADKTTWYADALRVTDEAVGAGDGANTVFQLAHGNGSVAGEAILDMAHGKVTDEDTLAPHPVRQPGGGSYLLIVKLAGVAAVERVFGETSGGDYTADYATGVITFFAAPGNGVAVTASYFYSPANAGSTYFIAPASPNKLTIDTAEAAFTQDWQMNDNIVSAVFMINPGNPGGPKIEIPGTRAKLKRFTDVVNYTRGSFPTLKAGGGGVRGLAHDLDQLRWEFGDPIQLKSSWGLELRLWLEHHRPFGGELCNVTYYGFEEAE